MMTTIRTFYLGGHAIKATEWVSPKNNPFRRMANDGPSASEPVVRYGKYKKPA
jgi:hypothetical protein